MIKFQYYNVTTIYQKWDSEEAAIKLQISQPLLCKLLKKRIEIENSATFNKNPNIKRIEGSATTFIKFRITIQIRTFYQ